MLGISEIGLKILFLLIPGIIAVGVIKSVGPKQPRSDLENALQIFMYGIISYAVAGAIEGVHAWWTGETAGSLWKVVSDRTQSLSTLSPQAPVNLGQILIATLSSIVISLLVALTRTYGYIHKIMFRLHLTQRQSEVDIWGYTLNSRIKDNWVIVRHTNDKIYQGWISGYSEGNEERELLLTQVTVYVANPENNNELVEVDSLPVLYLGLDRKSVVLEFQRVESQTEGESGNEEFTVPSPASPN